ncbi:hypothetical protein L5I01_07800 [Gordonia sp. HY442]|uniref:hypothetical protein n=1 Tax=Gordonia zhenghanii TaxID=2911516 RepID=UPI001F2C8589|nr:hypothetical protein [Gordonia zhenghanii]MCF8603263.1 hypothetical protein [Gordonia zhenghanii]
MTTPPTAPRRTVAYAVGSGTTRRGVRFVVVSCPYCRRRHTHGDPPDATDYRIAHCKRGEYRIERRASR